MRISVLILLAAALTAVGCGSSGGGGAGNGPKSPADAYADAVKFSSCMRSHGVTDFPDPQQQGNGVSLTLKKGQGPDPSSPVFRKAQNACRKYQPGGGKAQPISPQMQQQMIRYAQCIRTHGVPNFPDPQFSGGGVRMKFSGAGPGDPGFDRAQRACQSLLPGAKGGGPGAGLQLSTGPGK